MFCIGCFHINLKSIITFTTHRHGLNFVELLGKAQQCPWLWILNFICEEIILTLMVSTGSHERWATSVLNFYYCEFSKFLHFKWWSLQIASMLRYKCLWCTWSFQRILLNHKIKTWRPYLLYGKAIELKLRKSTFVKYWLCLCLV